jgi:transposase
MTSIKDIAKLAGVSSSTVSRVVNQRQYVRPEIWKPKSELKCLWRLIGEKQDGIILLLRDYRSLDY